MFFVPFYAKYVKKSNVFLNVFFTVRRFISGTVCLSQVHFEKYFAVFCCKSFLPSSENFKYR